MDKPLTNKEKKVFEWIKQFQHKTGGYPTYREIQDTLKFHSINSVSQYIKQLARKGYVELVKNRGYRLDPRELTGMVTLPLLGAVQAGGPNSTQENPETMQLPSGFTASPGSTFLLRVRGTSMTDAGIQEDDIVIVDRSRQAKVNDIVVALLEGENTVKRLVRDPKTKKLFLKAESTEHSDIYPENEWEIQGVVTGLWRSYL